MSLSIFRFWSINIGICQKFLHFRNILDWSFIFIHIHSFLLSESFFVWLSCLYCYSCIVHSKSNLHFSEMPFPDELPTEAALVAAKQLIRCGVQLGELDERYILLGGRQLIASESPGLELYSEIQDWDNWAAQPEWGTFQTCWTQNHLSKDACLIFSPPSKK